jgi:hypothetical protein
MMATSPDALDRLLFQPARWDALIENELIELLSWGCATYVGVKNDVRSEYLHRLYAHAVKTLPSRTRAQVAVDLMRVLEQLARDSGWGHPTAMVPFLKLDGDFVVVSTATLQAAQLIEPSNGDPMTGPRELFELALTTADTHVQVAMLAGLASLGDRRVFDIIDMHWHRIPRAAHNGLITSMSLQWPTVASIEFLVTRLERSADEAQASMPIIASALVRLAESAQTFHRGQQFAGAGVRDVEGVFPSWAVPAHESAVVVHASYSVGEIGSRINHRLERVAAGERFASALMEPLRAWGPSVPDATWDLTIPRS